ncbi:hypothetical protein HNO89_001802 [Sporosarcina luteola]|nr:hypothetical protein [Sporosarcina luteola]
MENSKKSLFIRFVSFLFVLYIKVINLIGLKKYTIPFSVEHSDTKVLDKLLGEGK